MDPEIAEASIEPPDPGKPKARSFNIEEMIALNRQNAQKLAEEALQNQSSIEADKLSAEPTDPAENSTVTVQNTGATKPDKNPKKVKKHKKEKKKEKKKKKDKKKKHRGSDESSGDEDVGPMLPPGFMPSVDDNVGPSFPPGFGESRDDVGVEGNIDRKNVGPQIPESSRRSGGPLGPEFPPEFGGGREGMASELVDSRMRQLDVSSSNSDMNAKDFRIGEVMPEADESSSDNDDENHAKYPVTSTFTFYHGEQQRVQEDYEVQLKKAMTSMCVNAQGNKIATGGADYGISYYDFGGMDSRGLPFKEVVAPCQAHQIRDIGFNSKSDKILVASGKFQGVCLNMDGNLEFETVEGDRYITDQAQTKGHQSMLNGCMWHPRHDNQFMTFANDGTVRTWDCSTASDQNLQVRKCKTTVAGIQRPTCTAASYSSQVTYGGSKNSSHTSYGIVAGSSDGALHFWDERQNPLFTKAIVKEAHGRGTISDLSWSHCGRYIVSRSGGDETLKVWDVRTLSGIQKGDKRSLARTTGISIASERADVSWSPNDNLICFSTSEKDKRTKMTTNLLYFVNPQTGAVEDCVDLSEKINSTICRTVWQDKINQIFLASQSGKGYVLYDKHTSRNGALLCVNKKKKNQSISAKRQGPIGEIIAPIGLPIIKESDAYNITDVGIEIRYNRWRKQQGLIRPKHKVYQQLDEWAPRQAEGLGQDAIAANLARELAKETADVTPQNVRESILRHADVAAQNPKYVTQAYKETQPITFYQDDEATAKRKLAEAKKNVPAWKKLKTDTK